MSKLLDALLGRGLPPAQRIAAWAVAGGAVFAWYKYDQSKQVTRVEKVMAGARGTGLSAEEAKEWNAAVIAKQRAEEATRKATQGK